MLACLPRDRLNTWGQSSGKVHLITAYVWTSPNSLYGSVRVTEQTSLRTHDDTWLKICVFLLLLFHTWWFTSLAWHIVFCACLVLFNTDKLYMGPGQLYQDLQNLIHDLSLVNQISNMIGSLKGNYQVRTMKKTSLFDYEIILNIIVTNNLV